MVTTSSQFSNVMVAGITAILMAACASTGGASPDIAGHWQSMGISGNGNIEHAIDKDSIQRQGNMATFRDKKTVIDMSKENYSKTPAYKVAVGDWEMDCRRITFRLKNLQLFDAKGQSIGQYQYSSSDLRPMAVVRGSATEKQYEQVCGKKL